MSLRDSSIADRRFGRRNLTALQELRQEQAGGTYGVIAKGNAAMATAYLKIGLPRPVDLLPVVLEDSPATGTERSAFLLEATKHCEIAVCDKSAA